ncbi:MAG: hypothetical protein ACLT98_03975 [Eggerthellaceae bacterium]
MLDGLRLTAACTHRRARPHTHRSRTRRRPNLLKTPPTPGTLLDDYTAEKSRPASMRPTERPSPRKKTPVVSVEMIILELFWGPTSAFKDVALQMLPQLMSRAASQTSERIMILAATSGDTGKAALAGFADTPNLGITVFYPHGGTSEIQRLQMVTQAGENVAMGAVRRNFDDTQSAVKRIFGDEALRARCKAERRAFQRQLHQYRQTSPRRWSTTSTPTPNWFARVRSPAATALISVFP